MKNALMLTAALLALTACKRADMAEQNQSRNWDLSQFFANGTAMRHPVAGTVARDAPNPPAAAPAVIDAALMSRGHERFEIFCTPCHGRLGDGGGMIVQRGFPHPPSFLAGKLRQAKADVFYDAITNGYGAMYSFASRVPPADRWAIVAYIRALQLSQDAAVASLPGEDRAKLAALP